MTNGFTHWLITKRVKLFRGADPHVSSFWLMHMIEETEHKTVAFDTFMAFDGRYLPRFIGVWHGSWHVLWMGIKGMLLMLKKDGILYRPRTLLGIARQLAHSSPTWGRSCSGPCCPDSTREKNTTHSG